MAAYRRVYDSRHLQADCQEPGSAPDPTLGSRVWATFFIQKDRGIVTVCSYWGDHRSKCLPQLTSSLPLFILLMGPDALCFWVVRLCVRVCLLGWRHSPTSLPSTCSFYSLIVQMLVAGCCTVECSCTEQHASLVYTTSLCSVVSRFCALFEPIWVSFFEGVYNFAWVICQNFRFVVSVFSCVHRVRITDVPAVYVRSVDVVCETVKVR